MDIKFLFYIFLCIIAFIFIIHFGNKKSVLIKEKEFYRKLLRLKLKTRIFLRLLLPCLMNTSRMLKEQCPMVAILT